MRIGIIVGSTRPARKGLEVAQWVYALASQRKSAEYELIDLKDQGLPLLDEPVPPSMTKTPTQEHTKRWASKIAGFDGFVLVTPEYNHGPPAALKNALDFLYDEWRNKSVGFVGYGGVGAARSIEMLRAICANLELADVRVAVSLMLAHDFENFSKFKPLPHQEKTLAQMLDQVEAWAGALQPLRKQ
ncbi:MAG: NAD(P)H-dependent oxidoreductase [Steroidobacteraceae bacterium]